MSVDALGAFFPHWVQAAVLQHKQERLLRMLAHTRGKIELLKFISTISARCIFIIPDSNPRQNNHFEIGGS